MDEPLTRASLRALAQFGQSAVRTTDLPRLLNEAIVVAVETLRAECGAIVEMLADGDFVLRAGVGLSADAAGQRVSSLSELGLDSATRVTISGRHGPWGVIALQPQRSTSFTAGDVDFLQSMTHVLALAIARDAKPAGDSEARFAKAFQASPVALGMATVRDGRIRDVNDSWLEMFGYRRDEVIGRTNAELSLSVDPRSREDALRRIRNEGSIRNFEMQGRTKQGEILDLIASAVIVVLADDEEAWLSALLDITDRKRAEAERTLLLESEKAARTAAEIALERLRAIESITDSALQNLDLDELLQKLLVRVSSALNANFASVALVDESRNELYLRAVSGRVLTRAIRSPIGEGVSGRVAADGQPRIVHDLATVDLSKISGVSSKEILALNRSVVSAPLYAGGKIVGVVTAASPEPNHFEEEDLKLLLVVADRVGPAIERARLLENVHAASERSKALSARILTAQEEERRRVAVELHDALGQILTAVKINLQSLERTLGAQSKSGDLAHALASVDDAMERVRDLALDLRPSVLDDLGLPAALRWYGDRFAHDTHIDVQFSIDAIRGLDSGVETACFRVAQEALTNVARHAQARRVWVGLHRLDGDAELTVRDDGVGFDVAAARDRASSGISIGILGMEERVASLAGTFAVQSIPGKGSLISARFPVGESA